MTNDSYDISAFLDHFTIEFLSEDDAEEELKLDRETLPVLLSSMDNEYDEGVLRSVIALLHTRSEMLNLHIDLTSARRNTKCD